MVSATPFAACLSLISPCLLIVFVFLFHTAIQIRDHQLKIKNPKLQENHLPVQQKHPHILLKDPLKQMNQPHVQLKLYRYPDKKTRRASK
jgi:hypothetical protein